MLLSQIGKIAEGTWRGIEYRVTANDCSERYDELTVYVHKDLLEKPGEGFETQKMSFLGYEWTVCLMAKEDGRVEVFWHLDSPVDERESLRCCWRTIGHHFVLGPSCSLKQNGRYGGIFEIGDSISNGFFYISFCFRLLTSNELHSVYQNESEISYVMPVIAKERGSSVRTDRFTWQGREWGVSLELRGTTPMWLTIEIPQAIDSNYSYCLAQAVIIDPSSPDLSQIQSEQISVGAQNRAILFFDPPSPSGESSEHSFEQEARFKLGLRLILSRRQSTSVEEFSLSNGSKVAIEMFIDEHIKEHVEKEASIDIFGTPTTVDYLCPPHQSLKTLKQTMQKDIELDSTRLTFWLLCGERKGVFSKAVWVDALDPFDFRLCELSMEGSLKNNQSITFYCRPGKDKEVLMHPQSSVLLFCTFFDPREGKLEFLGSIVADGHSKLHSICFGDICGLREGLKDTDCSFFKMDCAKRITKINIFQETVKASDLTSGCTIVVRPIVEDEDVTAERFRQELLDLRIHHLCNQAILNRPPVDNEFVRWPELCIICQDHPQTSGFYHGETVHLCACEACARMVYDREPRRCPICMQPCTGLITKIF